MPDDLQMVNDLDYYLIIIELNSKYKVSSPSFLPLVASPSSLWSHLSTKYRSGGESRQVTCCPRCCLRP